MTISLFQYQVYWSFVVSFCLFGLSGVLLLRDSLRCRKLRTARFIRRLGWFCCALSLHGFLIAYLYVGYLRRDGAQLPLAATMLAWTIAVPWLIFQFRQLDNRLPKWSEVFYGIAYFLALCSIGVAGAVFSTGLALVSCVGCAIASSLLWNALALRGRETQPGGLMKAALILVVCPPGLLLFVRLGPDAVWAQAALNLFSICFAAAVLLFCRRLKRAPA